VKELYAVLGSPIAHSLSPVLHAAGFAAAGRNFGYGRLEVDEAGFDAALERVRAEGYRGVNLTSPLKSAGFRRADELTPFARAAGSANTLAFDGGRIHAENTDGPGFVRFLARSGVSPRGRAIVFLGGGGATAGLVPSLVAAGVARIGVVARTPERTRALYPALAHPSVTLVPHAAAAHAAALVGEAGLIVQATPLGRAAGDPLPCPAAWVAASAVAVDLLYDPPVSPWRAALAARGVRSANGLGLLIEQALLAQRFWFGEEPPRHALEEAVAWTDPFSSAPGSSPAG
jgi:shikimate dehydrogenase